MGKLKDLINRWRHARGYGVHSPFGYELVTRAVHPGDYGWYGYSAIEGAMGHDPDFSVRRQARMLLRLAAFLQPKSAFLPQGSHPAYHAALSAADSRMKIKRVSKLASECEMISSNADFIPKEVLIGNLRQPNHWIVVRDIPKGWADDIYNSLEEGLMFEGPRNLFVINRPGMQKVRHTMPIG